MNLTPRQHEILTLIRDSRRKHGYSPTMQEMGDALGIAKTTAMEHVEALIRKGLIVRTPDVPRGLSLAEGVLEDSEALIRECLGPALDGDGLEAYLVAADDRPNGLRAGDYIIREAGGKPRFMVRKCA